MAQEMGGGWVEARLSCVSTFLDEDVAWIWANTRITTYNVTASTLPSMFVEMCQHYFFIFFMDMFTPKTVLLQQKGCPLLKDGCTLHVFEVFLSKFLRKILSLLGYCSTCGFPAIKLSLPKVRAKAQAFLRTNLLSTG